MALKLVENLVHLECGEDVLDQYGALYAVRWKPEDLL